MIFTKQCGRNNENPPWKALKCVDCKTDFKDKILTFTSENFKDANEDDCQDMNVMVAFMAIPTNPTNS